MTSRRRRSSSAPCWYWTRCFWQPLWPHILLLVGSNGVNLSSPPTLLTDRHGLRWLGRGPPTLEKKRSHYARLSARSCSCRLQFLAASFAVAEEFFVLSGYFLLGGPSSAPRPMKMRRYFLAGTVDWWFRFLAFRDRRKDGASRFALENFLLPPTLSLPHFEVHPPHLSGHLHEIPPANTFKLTRTLPHLHKADRRRLAWQVCVGGGKEREPSRSAYTIAGGQ